MAELGLSWDLSFWFVPRTEPGGSFPVRILCDPVKKTHEVWVNQEPMNNLSLFIPDLVHELCHASLAERVDGVFATSRFGPESNRLDCEDPDEFVCRASELFLAKAHEDIWINDLRHAHWPEISQQDADSFAQSAFELTRQNQWEGLRQPTSILGLALQLAEVKRHHLRPIDISPLLRRGLGRDVWRFITETSEFYESLARLQNNRGQDLVIFEASVQEAARKFGLSIHPRLIEGEGQAVWEVV